MENRIRGLLFQPPKLGDGQKGKQYVVCGFMIEKYGRCFHCMLTLKTSPTDGKPALILYIPEVYLILFSGYLCSFGWICNECGC